MLIPFLISKIHNARVTGANTEYSGSIAIDAELIKKADLKEFQKVEIYNISNGNRFSTYIIQGEGNTGEIVLNGAAAHKVSIGDRIIIAAYALLDERELNTLNATILIMDKSNNIERIIRGKL